MKNRYYLGFSFFHYFMLLLGVILLGLGLATCSGTGSPDEAPLSETPPPEQLNDETRQPIGTLLPNGLLGFVSNPDGQLIPFASIGGASTDKTGVTTGAATATAAGWYQVEANGYATSYAQPSGKINGVDILSAILLPVDTEAFHPVGGTTIIDAGPLDSPLLTVTLDAADFAVDAIVEITKLDAGLLSTTYAPMNTADVLYINHPFEIRARSVLDGTLLQPESGQVVEVTFRDSASLGGAIGDPVRLLSFDPDQGMWIEQGSICSRADIEHVSCQLSHFSQHGAGGSAHAPPSGAGSAHARATNTTNANFQDSARDVAQNGGGMCDVFTPAVVSSFMTEVNAALAEASSSPSEAAKKMVADTAGRLQLTGGYGPADSGCNVFPSDWDHAPNPYDDLMQALDDITKKLASDLLVSPDCPDLDAINKVLAEADLLGLREVSPIPALWDKYEELLDRCNIVEGRVEYVVILPKASLPGTTRFSGPRYWSEYHTITLNLHASASGTATEEVGTFDGTDLVESNFARVSYREADEGCSPVMYDIEDDIWGEPSSGTMTIMLAGQFNPSDGIIAESATASNNMTLTHQTTSRQIGVSAETGCYISSEIPLTFNSPFTYHGQIAEQTPHLWPEQPVIYMNDLWLQFTSLWQILNRVPSSSMPGGPDSYPRDFYNGMEMLNNVVVPFALPNMQVVMRWNIMHTDYTKGR